MELIKLFESLEPCKSQKLVYDSHDVLYLKFDTNKRIGIVFKNVDIDLDQTKKFRGFYTRSLKEEKEFYIQTEGNLAEREIFCHMSAHILKEAKKLKSLVADDIEDAIKSWVNFGRKIQQNLDVRIQLGLYGELLFLKFARKYLSDTDLMLAWHGPDRKKVDFVFSENLAVEVKATSDPLSKDVWITSVQQLSDGYENHLLRVYKLVVVPRGKKINQLFNEILEGFNRDDKEAFINKCCEYGYNHLLDYDNLKPISNQGVDDFLVSKRDFPKIQGGLDPRIIDIKYRISLKNEGVLEPNYMSSLLKTFNNS